MVEILILCDISSLKGCCRMAEKASVVLRCCQGGVFLSDRTTELHSGQAWVRCPEYASPVHTSSQKSY